MSDRYGMSASISAISVVYLLVGLLMVVGIRTFMPRRRWRQLRRRPSETEARRISFAASKDIDLPGR